MLGRERAAGSAFSGSSSPSAPEHLVLVAMRPGRRPGTKISQTPARARSRIGWRRPSQPLKSPTTLTRRAFGAQTAKRDALDALDARSDARRASGRLREWCPRPADAGRARRAPGRSGRDRPRIPARARPTRRAAGSGTARGGRPCWRRTGRPDGCAPSARRDLAGRAVDDRDALGVGQEGADATARPSSDACRERRTGRRAGRSTIASTFGAAGGHGIPCPA